MRREENFDLEKYIKLADAGDVEAQLKLGDYYYECEVEVLEKNNYEVCDKSKEFVIKSLQYYKAAADQGGADAQYEYAQALHRMDSNHDIEFEYYMKAATQGHAEAMNEVGSFYEYGFSVEEDFEKAAEYYNKAIEADPEWASDFHLEKLSEKIHEKDQTILKEFDDDTSNEDLIHKAYCYMNGILMEEDDNKAFELYYKAYQNGSIEGMFYTGIYYLNGYTCEANEDKAFELMKKAADAGHKIAQFSYAYYNVLYYNNYSEAFKYYKLSAEQGNPQSMLKLSYLYKMGLGVEKNFKLYIKYLMMAQQLGVEYVE